MRLMIAAVLVGSALVTLAQAAEQMPSVNPGGTILPPLVAPRTAKERLGDKASDEQRVNDCNVPVERRTRARSADCPWDVTS